MPTSTGWFQVLPSTAVKRASSVNLSAVADDQGELAFFRDHEQRVLIGQQDHLSLTVAAALPLPCAVREVDARENVAVEAEGMSLVHDEILEVRLQPARRPALFRPSIRRRP